MDCRRRKAKPSGQLVAPLPRIRVKEPLKAFCKVAGFCWPIHHGSGKRETRQETPVPINLLIVESSAFRSRICNEY